MTTVQEIEFPSLADALLKASRHPSAAVLTKALKAIPKGGTICVAASGGADSTALALVAKAIMRRGDWSMCLATVDHSLRAEAAMDADFARQLAHWLEVPCSVMKVRPGAGAGVADRARRHRYEALAKAAAQAGASAILTAHHAEDQLETMLLRLARGAGPKAIGGMRGKRKMKSGVLVLRPFLELSRKDLRALLKQVSLPWREDPTNADPTKPRARIRAGILPVLDSIHQGSAVRASRAARRLRESGRLLEKTAATVATGAGPWSRTKLRSCGPALLATRLQKLSPEANERELEDAVHAIRDRINKPRIFQLGKKSLSVTSRKVHLA
ncbi:MAG: tRNA lysidine(34) synthetase TilS [Planctomycetes bacterium]|nr:tRNA lysidine(34) synthetase TilS [Planctomycetota bacterium]